MVAFAKQTAAQPPAYVTAATNANQANGGQPGASGADSSTAIPPAESRLAQAIRDTNGLGLELGWKSWPTSSGAWLLTILGLLVSTLAVSMGAPFWFDVLKRFVNLRSAGEPPTPPAPDAQATAATPAQ